MVDSEYSKNISKILKISIRAVMTNPGTLKFISNHLYIQKMCKTGVKKLPFVIRYVPDQYKTQHMFDKAALENGGTVFSWLI